MSDETQINRFPQLVKEKEKSENRKIGIVTMAEETGVAYTTAKRWFNNDVSKIHVSTVTLICDWLGRPLSDLLVYDPNAKDGDNGAA